MGWVADQFNKENQTNQKVKAIATVNVLEENAGSLVALYSFPDTVEGNKDAEKVFADLVLENGGDPDDIDDYLDDGRFWDEDEYTVMIVHSIPVEEKQPDIFA